MQSVLKSQTTVWMTVQREMHHEVYQESKIGLQGPRTPGLGI